MKVLLIPLIYVLLIFAVKCNAQPPEKRQLVVDETEVVKSGDKKFRVISCNDEIAQTLFAKYQYDSCIVSISATKKEDKRHKEFYWEYSIYFLNEKYSEIVSYLKKQFQ